MLNNITTLDIGEDIATNVLLYIGDAVREDFIPSKLADAGASVSCIAASIHSPTSFASIISGMYLSQHSIRSFKDSLSPQLPNLLKSDTHTTAFANTINDPIFHSNTKSKSIISSTLSVNESNKSKLETIEPPFVFVERGPGGHAPYGDFNGGAGEYFRQNGSEPIEKLRKDYHSSVERDVNWFLSRVELLSERGLLDDTLVIYTSDHGEMLGESGMVGHNGIIWPSLVRVPSIFIHPSIPSNCGDHSGVVRHIDFLPTIASAVDGTFQNETVALGRDLTTQPLAERGAAMYDISIFDDHSLLPELRIAYDSVWDGTGGYVFPTTSRVARSADMFRRLMISSKQDYFRRHLPQYIWSYIRDERTHGTPLFSKDVAHSDLKEIRKTEIERETMPENEVPRERLEELGYLE